MKRFISYSLIFALIVGLTLAAGEALCRLYPNPYAYKDKWLRQHASEVETLILGSSVSYYGINPALLPGKSFSLAGVSQNPEYDYLLLKRYFGNTDHAPQCIILPIGYTTYTDSPLEESRDWMYAQGYRIYMGIDRNPWLSRYGLELLNLNGYAGKLRNMFGGHNSIICDTLGHGTAMSTATRPGDFLKHINLTVSRHATEDFSYKTYNLAFIDSILDWSQSHGTKVVLVSTPKMQVYRDAIPATQRELTRHLTDSIAASRHITWIDMTDDPEFGDGDFYDGDHLTSDYGADHFTVRLRDLLPPLR